MSSSASHSLPPTPHPAPTPLSSSSSVTCCPELDLSVTFSPAPKTDHTQQKPRPPKPSPQEGKTQPKASQQGRAGKRRTTKVCSEEQVTCQVADTHLVPAQHPVKGLTKDTGRCHAGSRSVHPPAATRLPGPSCLERAELNTTLALRAELHSLQGSEFNSQKALQETLQKSERTKNLINARAAEVVNVSRSQLLFNSLVSVRVQEDQLIGQVLQDRRLPAPPPPRSHETKVAEGPSLPFFMTTDLFRQKPLPQEEELGTWKPSPMLCPAYTTFDLHRRQRCWETTP